MLIPPSKIDQSLSYTKMCDPDGIATDRLHIFRANAYEMKILMSIDVLIQGAMMNLKTVDADIDYKRL
nr:hypothetical protein [Tanacetum cinerariifolium]